MRYLALILAVFLPGVALAGSMRGHWTYEATEADPVYGEPERLLMVIRLEGKTVCGNLMSAWRGGMKVDEREFKGELRRGVARVEYGGEEDEGHGRAELRLRGQTLVWRVTAASGQKNYVVRRAILRRGNTVLEDPKGCAK